MVKFLKNLVLVGALLGTLQPMGMSAASEQIGEPDQSWFTTDNLVYGVGVLTAVAGLAFAFVNPTDIKVWLYGMNDELIEAAVERNLKKVKYLIKNGTNLNAKEENGWTALSLAAWHGYSEIVECLIKHGADVNASDKDGSSPLYYAAGRGYSEVVKLLMKHKADVNAKDKFGDTPLHHSAANGKLETVKDLIENGANVNEKNNNNETPLYRAAKYGYLEVVKYLVEKGAKVDEKNNNKTTPLEIAQNEKKTHVAAYLELAKDFFAVIAKKTNAESFIEKYLSKSLSEKDKTKFNANFADIRGLLLPFGNEEIAKQSYKWYQENSTSLQLDQFNKHLCLFYLELSNLSFTPERKKYWLGLVYKSFPAYKS